MHELSDWILATATVVLAFATVGLVIYTKALSALTKELVNVEVSRDKQREENDRLREIAHALKLVESLRDLKATDFASQLKGQTVPKPHGQYVRELALLAPRHIKDPDTVQNLRELRQWIDMVQHGGNIGGNEATIAKLYGSIQDRSGWSITEWRDELERTDRSFSGA